MKPLRIALSGCGFRLGGHLGALKACIDAGYQPIEMASTSGGSIVAALYSAGLMSLDDLQTLMLSMDWAPMMKPSPWAMLTKGALCSGDPLLKFLMEKTGGITFSALTMDLKIIASDLVTEKEFVFSRETTPDCQIALAARASASIPVVFPPVEYRGACLVDGGCTDNIPADALTIDSAPRIGIYLVSEDPPLLPAKRGLLDLAPRMIDLLLASNEAAHVDFDKHTGAVIVPVETAYASSFDRHMSVEIRHRLYMDGYAETLTALKKMPQ